MEQREVQLRAAVAAYQWLLLAAAGYELFFRGDGEDGDEAREAAARIGVMNSLIERTLATARRQHCLRKLAGDGEVLSKPEASTVL